MTITDPPSFVANLFTLGIARARWISATNTALGHSTGFLFAYFLQAFANYGLAGRMNEVLRSAGSNHQVSQPVCFLLTGFPFIGALSQMRKGTAALNRANAVAPPAAA